MSKETIGEWVKLTVNVFSIFKRNKDKIRRGEELVWVPSADFDCKCPKLKLDKTYLIMSNDVTSSTRVGVIVDRSSIVLKWTELLGKRLKEVMRAQHKGERC